MLINVTAMQACDVCACVTLYFQSFKKSAFFFVRIVVLLLHLNQSNCYSTNQRGYHRYNI